MGSLANKTIASTYDGLVKTSTDDAVPSSGKQILQDGTGNNLALSVGRSGNGVDVTGGLTASGLSYPTADGNAGEFITTDGNGALSWAASGGGLEGTQYVFVAANGTDVENAAELQAAYTTAISKRTTGTMLKDIGEISSYDYGGGTFEIIMYDLNPFTELGVYNIVIEGVAYTMEVIGFPYPNSVIATIDQYYNIIIPSLSTYVEGTFPSTIIAANGLYNFSSDFVMDTEYVNLVSLDGNRSIVFNGEGTLSLEADNVFVKGVDVQLKAFKVSDNLPNITIENCSGGDDSFGSDSADLSGTFNDCTGGSHSFGGDNATILGTFTNCTAVNNSFGGYQSNSGGTFINCEAGNDSFGGYDGSAGGIFTNCKAKNYSFGGGNSSISAGIFTNCEAWDFTFGTSQSPGTFTNCIGGGYSFSDGGIASGTFNNCTGWDNSFGSYGTASGTFSNCIGSYKSFGGSGTLSGQLFYCRLAPSGGTFQTVSGNGRTVLCIDGNYNINNQ